MDDGFWHGSTIPSGIWVGVIGEENPDHPGVYRFDSTDGYSVNDAHLLTPDGDTEGGGEETKPRPGSPCVALVSNNGGQCYITGYSKAPEFDEDSDDIPAVGNADENNSAGDKVYKTSGGATLVLKRGGAVYIEGGPGVSFILNPLNNQMSLRAGNFKHTALGYAAVRGRKEPGTTKPETVHTEDFLHQVGADARDRFRIEHGDLESDARRRLSLSEVTIIASQESVTVKTRETYFNDGSWIGEGPKYQWGGADADEPIVLGNALVDVIKKLSSIIKGIKVPTAWGPSGTPLPPTPIDLTSLEGDLDKILSEFMYVTKTPAELG